MNMTVEQAFDPRVYRTTFLRSIRSELRKLTSLRSTWFTLAAFLVFASLLTCAIAMSGHGLDQDKKYLPAAVVSSFFQLNFVFILVIAALAVTGEYSSNTMRTTLLSQSNRSRAFFAKMSAVAIFTGIATAVILACQMLVAQLASGLSWTFGNGNGRSLSFYWIALIFSAVMTTALGYLIRSTAGTIVFMFAFVFVLEIVTLIPSAFVKETLVNYLPGRIMNAIVSTNNNPNNILTPNMGLLVWVGYTALFCLLGLLRYRRSDA